MHCHVSYTHLIIHMWLFSLSEGYIYIQFNANTCNIASKTSYTTPYAIIHAEDTVASPSPLLRGGYKSV